MLNDVVQTVGKQPYLRKRAHEIPDSAAGKTVFGNEPELGGKAAGVLEPDLVDDTVLGGIVKIGRLGRLVILNGNAVLQGKIDGLLVGNGFGRVCPCTKGSGQS